MGLSLDRRRVLLTGSTGGLGRSIARALHARGATVAATGRRQHALESLREELGDRIEPLVADLAAHADLAGLIERAGRIDVLVANAAVPAGGTIFEHSDSDIDAAVAVNLRAPMLMARMVAPAMVRNGGGHIVFMSSLAGKAASPGGSVYTATKYGLRGFAASLRAELSGTGVGATAVFPSFIAGAGMWADTRIELPRGVHLPSPDDVAAAVVKGIEKDRGEIDVAPIPLRLSAALAGVAPGVVAAVGSRLGAGEVADQAAAAQRPKR